MVQRKEKKKKGRFTDTKIITKSHLFGRQIIFTATGLSDSLVNFTNVPDIPDLLYVNTHPFKTSKTGRSCYISSPSPVANMSVCVGPELSNGDLREAHNVSENNSRPRQGVSQRPDIVSKEAFFRLEA